MMDPSSGLGGVGEEPSWSLRDSLSSWFHEAKGELLLGQGLAVER